MPEAKKRAKEDEKKKLADMDEEEVRLRKYVQNTLLPFYLMTLLSL